MAACAPVPIQTAIPTRGFTPAPIKTPQSVIVADVTKTPTVNPTSTRTLVLSTSAPASTIDAALPVATATLTPIPTSTPNPSPTATPTPPVSFLQQQITNLYDLTRLPSLQNSLTTQFTSRNWVSLEHFFDYFIDDGNFIGPNYGYIGEDGTREHYRIVPGYDGASEYEIVPRVQGPGMIARIWFAYQQHQSYNNPKDMSEDLEWNNWGNLGAMGNIRFYFDDEPTPRMDMSIKELFIGKAPFPAPLAAFYASADGGNINYMPIPFERSIRVTTTGRPRLMQIQVKRFAGKVALANSGTAADVSHTPPPNPVLSFTPYLTPDERTALDQATQAWQTCTPLTMEYKSFEFSIPNNNSAAIDFNNPATIASLRVHIPRGMDDSVWMQVFWDGENEPSMNAPLRAMFSTAEKLLPYHALPVGFDDSLIEHLFYLNFPMPYKSARIVFLNERAETLPVTVDVALRETVPGTESSRLHAFFGTRQVTAREDDGDNYVVLDAKGRGKYLGAILSAWDLDRRALNGPLEEHWRFPYLESNMDVWVDGRLALPGTGIEDDFNASYYYVFAGYPGYNTKYCLAGVTLLDYSTSKEPSSQYRFYLNDAPEFRDHLRVEVQHGNKGNNLSVTYSSTAFWYRIK